MVTGFILAGGASRRMGRDKAFLPAGDHLLIERVIRNLRLWVDRLVVIGHAANIGRLRRLSVDDALIDFHPQHGPLMGVYTGLMHTQTAVNLFVPCDMPRIQGRLIDRLLGACRANVDIVASLHPVQGLQPFPLVCRRRACRAVGALLDRQEYSLHALWRHPAARLVPIGEPALWRSFTNVNTADDYAQLQYAATFAPRR